MANYDYEIVNGRKIRVRPKETVSEIDKNGYFRRQPNHFTTPFGDGENDLKAEGNTVSSGQSCATGPTARRS